MIGETISHYKIIEKLGEGGMGVVYKALDTTLDRHVAIKFLPAHLSCDPLATKRFIHEAKVASAIDHSNIGTIFEINETDNGRTFIVMALYDGETLRQRLDRGDIRVDEALDIASQITSGLSKAHRKNIVHRDIKPSNIIITNDGEVKIIDFGLAKLAGRTKLTKEASALGTAAYMSPEQARGEDIDHRSDIFSLGVILYEMLSGEPPFKGDHAAALLYEIVHEDPDPVSETRPEIPVELERIVMRALEKRRAVRYQNANDLFKDIKSLEYVSANGRIGRSAVHRSPHLQGRTVAATGAAVIMALIMTVMVYLYLMRGAAIDSIAVLPLMNISDRDDEEYFVNGLTGELISQMAQIGGLKVISRTSVMQYRDSPKTLPEIARELDVDAVLEGVVMRAGDRVKISLELINARTDGSIWAESYERDLSDILVLHGEVALDVAKKIKLKLTPEEQEQLVSKQQVRPESHEAYLKGRYFWNQRTKSSLEKGLEFFKESIAADSSYASAYAGIADTYIMLGNYGGYDPSEIYPAARKAALKALELDNQLSEPHTALAIIKWHYDWDLKSAAMEFEEAVSLDPNNATAHQWYAIFLAISGDQERSIEEIHKALSVDPVSLIVNAAVGLIHYFAGDYDESIRQSRLTLDMDDDFFAAHTVLGRAYLMKELYKESISSFEKVISLSGRRSRVLALLAHPLHASGRIGDAEALYRELEERAQTEYVSPYDMAVITIALEKHDEAMVWLEKATLERSSAIFTIEADPLFKSLRDRQEFKVLTSKVGLRPM